jgi:uncharacterized damage-inducible protein DinB
MSQEFLANYQFLARYNQWFNERLYAACETLSDEERQRDRGAFFGSIQATLTHLMWADKNWLGRFAHQGQHFAALPAELLALPPGASFATALYDDFHALRCARTELDAAICLWLADMPADFLQSTMRYSNTKGVQRSHPAWQALTHVFNHQTHHRGQVTTLLAQAGVDVGVTDLIALV